MMVDECRLTQKSHLKSRKGDIISKTSCRKSYVHVQLFSIIF
jgi:hypothetical protein